MAVIIEEFSSEIVSEPARDGGGAGEARATEGPQDQAMIIMLELAEERKARLAID